MKLRTRRIGLSSDPMGRASRAKKEKREVYLLRSEFEKKLKTHLAFIVRSAAAYDQGHDDEALRIAVSLRVLFHDGGGKSLLQQLNFRRRLLFTDTAERINPNNLLPTFGLVIYRMVEGQATYLPPLNELLPYRMHPPAPFSSWWQDPVMKFQTITWSRRDLVLALSNQDGGAHVDPALDSAYFYLSRQNLLGVKTVTSAGRTDARGNPAMVAVRQIAYEVVDTFKRQGPAFLP